MMEYITVTLLFIILTAFAYTVLARKKKQFLPPGPRGYPVIGNILDLVGCDLRDVFTEYRKTYGDIFTVRIFSKVIIVCNGYDMLKDLLVEHGDVFAERPVIEVVKLATLGNGFFSPLNQQWKINRKFSLRALKEFGMGKNIMEIRIQNEVGFLMEKIEQYNGKPFNIKMLLHSAVANVIFSVVFGKRYHYDDPAFRESVQKMHENILTPVFFALPCFKYIPGDPFHIRRYFDNQKVLTKQYTDIVNQHLDHFHGDSPDNLIDAYIKEMRRSSDDGTSAVMNKEELITIVDNLAFGGTDTSATTLLWGLVYMLHNPSVQNKLKDELDDTISTDRRPGVADKKNLPFLEATINEIFRRSCIAPFGGAHTTARDVTFRGYDIPEHVMILPSIYSVLSDGDLWNDPECFSPTRFLNADGTVKNEQELIPFSLGKRSCPGEALGRMEVFLFLSALVRRFEFRPPEGDDPPPLDCEMGLTVAPKDFLIRAIPRNGKP